MSSFAIYLPVLRAAVCRLCRAWGGPCWRWGRTWATSTASVAQASGKSQAFA